MNQIIIQAIGGIGLIANIISFQKNKRSSILLYLIIGSAFFTLHFGLLHAWTGVAVNVLNVLRATLFYQKDTKAWAQHPVWMYIFMGAFILVGLATWTNYTSLFPIIAGVADTFALWKRSAKSIRFLMLFPRPFWFAYDFLVGSYPAMAVEVFVFASVLIGIVRFDILNQKKNLPLVHEVLSQRSE